MAAIPSSSSSVNHTSNSNGNDDHDVVPSSSASTTAVHVLDDHKRKRKGSHSSTTAVAADDTKDGLHGESRQLFDTPRYHVASLPVSHNGCSAIGKEDSLLSLPSMSLPRMTSMPHMTFESSGSSGDGDLEATGILPPKRARRSSDHSHSHADSDGDSNCCENGNGGVIAGNASNGGRPRSADTPTTDKDDPDSEPTEVPISPTRYVMRHPMY